MKKALYIIILILIHFELLAQEPKKQVMIMDTINVRGKIISIDGSKVSNIFIQSKTPNKLYFDSYNIGTYTDSLGNFELIGLKPIDTLSFRALSSDHIFINNGSRQITIKINQKVLENKVNDIPTISAKRVKRKNHAKFILSQDYTVCYFPTFSKNAEFRVPFQSFSQYINKNLIYPIPAIKNNIEGKVTIEFTVGTDGSILNPKIINGLGHGCDEAAIDVVLKSPKWIPEILNSKPVNSIHQTDIIFKLEG